MFDVAFWPLMDLSEHLLFFITLLTLFSPPAAIAAFATITDRFPEDIQKKVAKRVARNYFIVMVISIIIGEYILMGLGISTAALMMTGGMAVLVVGMPMMISGQKQRVPSQEEEHHAVPRAEWESVVSVPMTFPLTVGGATIAIAISAASQSISIVDYGLLIFSALMMAGVVYLVTLMASSLARRLGGSIDILIRASGIIIVAIAIQLLVKGIYGLIGIYS